MKRLVNLALLMLFAGVIPALAQKGGDLGVGLMAGDPTGLTGKYWLNGAHAVDMALGFEGDFSLHADYLIHDWKVFPQPRGQARLGAVIGAGAKVHDTGKDTIFGLRVPLGATLFLHPYPIEVFAEITPTLHLTPDTEGNIDGGIGVRFYFSRLR